MDKKRTAILIDWNAKQIIFIALATMVTWGLLITLGWAIPIDTALDNGRSQQTKSIDSEAPKSLPNDTEPQDFLSDSAPLSKASPEQQPQTGSDVSIVAVTGAGRECSTTGDSSQGSESCLDRKADGSFSESTTNHENFGNEKKEQTVIRYFTANGESAGEDTTRIKTSYRDNEDGSKQKEREFFDIVNQPPRGLITRDLIVKEYRQGELKKVTWAHYLEIGTRKAGLAHHAVLYYEDGKLTSGFANKYKGGKVIDTLLNYDPTKNPNLRIEKTGVLKWAGWIDQLIHTTSAASAKI